jgi:hypothetical protein
MKSDNERIEEFLKGIVLPEYKSDGHARQLRAQILSGLQARRVGSGTAHWWKTAALLLGLLGAAALATEVIIQVHHCYFEGKVKDGPYIFAIKSENAGTNEVMYMTGVSPEGGLDAAGIEQQRKDFEEVAALRERNAREIIRVTDTAVKGNPPVRMFLYKYVLADGRPWVSNEGELEAAEEQQIASLRQRGQREILKVSVVEFGGQRARTLSCRYVLSNGRAVTESEADPEQPAERPGSVHLTSVQWMELYQASLEKGEFLGSTQVQVHGRTVTLQRYSFKLSDGTVVTRSVGQLDASKRDVSAPQWQELNRLSAANKGEMLGTYEEDVRGKPFKFTRVKYVLSDGTEVIQSIGKPSSSER